MPKRYVAIQIDAQVFDRLHARRAALSQDSLRADNGLGVGATIGVLLDWWEQNPPQDIEAIRKLVKPYPERGRPRKVGSGPLVYVAGKKDLWYGHQFAIPKAHPHMHFCKVCEGWWDQHDYPKPLHPCPAVTPSSLRLMTRTKKDFLVVGFTSDEVEWAPE